MMLHGVADQVTANIKKLRRRVRDGSLVVIDDIFSGIAPLPAPNDIFCLDGIIPETITSTKNLPVSPGLSFRWNAFGLEKFGSGERLRRTLDDTAALIDFQRHKAHNRTFLHSSDDPVTKKLINQLGRAVELVSRHSLNATNRRQEAHDSIRRQLISNIETEAGKFGLIDLANFLHENTKISFGLIHLSPSNSTSAPLARTVTISTPTSQTTTLEALTCFLDVTSEQRQVNVPEIDRTFTTILLPHNPSAELIVNAGIGGRPLASYSDNASIKSKEQAKMGARLLIVPITRPPIAREKSTSPGLVASDLLFAFTQEIDLDTVGKVISCVEAFAHHRFGARRVGLLTRLQPHSKPEAPSISNEKKAEDLSSLDSSPHLLQHVLHEILYTTSAHSASVRTYDAASQSLKIVAFAGGTSGDREAVGTSDTIKIKGNTANSVVVFTFLVAHPTFKYTYIRKILPPLQIEIATKKGQLLKTINRAEIPTAYRSAGLNGVLVNRTSTRSELCFPLVRGRLAFGTLNLEAPYQSAFEDDLSYLELVKNGIENILSASDQSLDSRWLLASAARSDAIHQLWQYQDSGSFFTPEQNSVLDQIFSSREQFSDSDHSKESPTTAKLQSKIEDWIRMRWRGELLEQTLAMIKFDSLSDRPINDSFYRTALIAMRNIIENSVKYGEPKDDLFFVDDRPWFGSRSVKALRIYYRSSNPTSKRVIDLLGKAPIEQSAPKRVSFGMYNVGLLVRLLGGSLHTAHHPESLSLVVEIHLPYPQTGDVR